MAKKHKEQNTVELFDNYEIDEPIRKNNKEIKEEPKTKDALELARENYKEYGLYVGSGRAYPQILDGTKSSYKRAIYGMWKD